MITTGNDTVHVVTTARTEDWYYRLRRRLLVLSAAVRTQPIGEDIREAISAELEDMIEMLPDERQMEQLLSAQQ